MSRERADKRSGILLIDKPAQITSAKVVSRIKRVLQAPKVGHAGTLDPFATGLLICLIGRATRLARFFLESDKTYRAALHLGVTTDTGDVTGKSITESPGKIPAEEGIRAVFERFTGKIRQVPPVYSALKHQGVPLYRWARQGKAIQKPPRTVTIHRLKVHSVDLPEVSFQVTCSAGTYIRSLAVDVGAALGCGGHLLRLRRIQSGDFHVNDAVPFDRVDDPAALKKRIIPMTAALPGWPEHRVGDAVAEKVRHGRSISDTDFSDAPDGVSQKDKAPFIKLVDEKGSLVALLHRTETGSYGYVGVFGD